MNEFIWCIKYAYYFNKYTKFGLRYSIYFAFKVVDFEGDEIGAEQSVLDELSYWRE